MGILFIIAQRHNRLATPAEDNVLRFLKTKIDILILINHATDRIYPGVEHISSITTYLNDAV